jgi:hypothetical protein
MNIGSNGTAGSGVNSAMSSGSPGSRNGQAGQSCSTTHKQGKHNDGSTNGSMGLALEQITTARCRIGHDDSSIKAIEMR